MNPGIYRIFLRGSGHRYHLRTGITAKRAIPYGIAPSEANRRSGRIPALPYPPIDGKRRLPNTALVFKGVKIRLSLTWGVLYFYIILALQKCEIHVRKRSRELKKPQFTGLLSSRFFAEETILNARHRHDVHEAHPSHTAPCSDRKFTSFSGKLVGMKNG